MAELTLLDVYGPWDDANAQTWDEANVPWEAQPDPDGRRVVTVVRENRIVPVSPDFKR